MNRGLSDNIHHRSDQTRRIATATLGTTIALVAIFGPLGESLQIVILVLMFIGVGYQDWRHHLRLGRFLTVVAASFGLVYAISLVGFYQNATTGEFDAGGTWVTNRSLGTALSGSLDTASFTATFFGYSCNTSYGQNCSLAPYYAGFGVAQGLLVTGLIVGNLATRRRS